MSKLRLTQRHGSQVTEIISGPAKVWSQRVLTPEAMEVLSPNPHPVICVSASEISSPSAPESRRGLCTQPGLAEAGDLVPGRGDAFVPGHSLEFLHC